MAGDRPPLEFRDTATAGDELERLRALLLVDDRPRQQSVGAELRRLEQRLDSLPRQLPEAIEAAHQSGQRLSRALLKPVGQALGTIARHEPQLLVSVLFPVIGPIIRRAIADALAGLVRNLNQTLEHSFSVRSWRWRLESWRTGVPFAQVVLRHTLSWRVEHLLWIEGGSGLLLAHATNSDAPIADRDAIAGMLTAISDFVRDAVLARPGEELERVEMGEFSVRLLRTPEAYLAAVVRGEPAAAVLESLERLSEELHAALDTPPRNYSDAAENRLAEWLVGSGQAAAERGAKREGGKRRPWAAIVLLLALLALLCWTWWRDAHISARDAWMRAQLLQEPGVEIDYSRYDGAQLEVRGRRDPLARDDAELASLLALAPEQLKTDWRPQLSVHPELFRRRLIALLQPPAGVQIDVVGSGLQVSGEWSAPPENLAARLDAFRAFLPVDSSRLRSAAPPVQPTLDLDSLNATLAALDVGFVGAAPDPEAAARVVAIATRVLPLLAEHPGLGFEAVGDSDGVGSAVRNTALRQARGEWLRTALIAAGIPSDRIRVRAASAAGGGERFLPARRAYLQVTTTP